MTSRVDHQPVALLTDEQVLSEAGFQNITLLADGDDATTYRAVQPALRRSVAVTLHRAPLAPDAQKRFTEQCAVLGRLGGHPNIVEVYGCAFGVRGRPYVVMELPGGGALAERSQRGQALGWGDVLDLVVALSGALGTAHRAGVVHGHITIDDVVVSSYGSPQLTGFAGVHKQGRGSAEQDVRDLATVASQVLDNPAAVPPPMRRLLAAGSRGEYRSAEEFGRAAQRVQQQLAVAVTPLSLPTTDTPAVAPRTAPDVPAARRRHWLAVAGVVVLVGAAVAGAVILDRGPTPMLDMSSVAGQWEADVALAEQLRVAPDAYLCQDPVAAADAQRTQVDAYRSADSTARVGVVRRDLTAAAGAQLFSQMSGQIGCLEQLPGLTQVSFVAVTAGEQAGLLRYHRPGAAAPVEIAVLMARRGGVVAQVVHLGYPRADPNLTEELRRAVDAALR